MGGPTRTDLVYGGAPERPLRLDVFEPVGQSRRTAVIQLHGGGWRAGSRQHIHPRSQILAGHGFTCIPVEYRLLTEAPWPAPLEDVLQAIAWTAENAGDLGIDQDRIVLQGYSAGAHLALLAAAVLPAGRKPAAVVAHFPPTEFRASAPDEVGAPDRPGRLDLPGWRIFDRATSAEEARSISPHALADEAFPPTMLLHGTSDRIRTHLSSLAFAERLNQLGVPVDLHLYAGQDHEFDAVPSYRDQVQAEVAFFLRRFVTDRAAIEADVAQNSMFARRP